MKDFVLTKLSLESFFIDIQNELDDTPLIVVTTQNGDTGTWSMTKLWRSWMGTTAKFMADNGCTMPLMISDQGKHYGIRPFNTDDAHLLFTHQWLGTDSDGVRLSWSRKGRDGMRAATKGERFNAMRRHEEFCIERGIRIFKTRDSEFCQIEAEQGY